MSDARLLADYTPGSPSGRTDEFSDGRTDGRVGSRTDRRLPETPARTEAPMRPRAPILPPPARTRRFSWNWATFALMVLLPTAMAGTYLYGYASDQYISEFRFRLRHAQPSRLDASSALSGLTGASAALETMTDSEIVVQYLQSRQLLDDIRPAIDIDRIYGHPDADWYSRLDVSAPVEERLRYWRHVADSFFDASTSIVTVKVRAFAPADAKIVAAALLESAEKLVNTLSERAQADKLKYARQSVDEKRAAWKQTEVALRQFRNANDVMIPTMQASESTGLDGNLRAGESKARAALDSLRLQGVSADSPQARTLQAQIASIQAEIRRTQTRVTRTDAPAAGGTTNGGAGAQPQTLASVLTTYEGLDVDAKIASKAYEMAIMAEQRARDEASQQQVYLDAFVQPATAEMSMYPVRWRVLVQVGFASFAAWCLTMLLWRAVMDHID